MTLILHIMIPKPDPNHRFYGVGARFFVVNLIFFNFFVYHILIWTSGEALELKQLNMFSWDASGKGAAAAAQVQLQAAPSQAEFVFKNYKLEKEQLRSQMKEKPPDKYGNAADQDQLPREVLWGENFLGFLFT